MLNGFRRFWAAEEVPRWFGFCLVLTYLGGMAGVGYLVFHEVRADTARTVRDQTEFAFRMLADRLSDEVGEDPDRVEPARIIEFQRPLRDFATSVRADWVRIVDADGVIAASTRAGEVGTDSGTPVAALPGAYGFEYAERTDPQGAATGWFVRAPLPLVAERSVSPSTGADGGASPDESGAGVPARPAVAIVKSRTAMEAAALYLEARFTTPLPSSTALFARATVPASILLGCGILFLLFRRLRVRLRSASQISGQLRHCPLHADRQERIAADIRSLQIADAKDEISTAWNQILDLVVELQEEVERARASGELNKAMGTSVGGILSQALNALSDGYMYISHDGRFEYTNAMARRLAGWAEDDVRDVQLADVKAKGAGEKVLEVIRAAARRGGGFESVSQVVSVEGDDSSYRVSVAPLAGDCIQGGAMVVVRDVSQQVRSEQVREEFVAQVTHELRTPLTNIRAYAETLSSGVIDDPKAVTDCYNVITKETRRLSRLIEDILSVSQMEVGSIQLEQDEVDLGALLTDTVRDLRGLADEKDLDLQLVLPPKMESIRADKDKLSVVITNLLGNSIKYTPKGGSIIVGSQIKSEQVVITVKDNGIGIDPRDHGRVFEKFQRSEDPDVQNETGSGIGLFTAREIIRRHGGDIDLISKKGEGATFVVRLPHKASRAGALVAEEVQRHG